jgi:phosphotransferase system enzyme I (PtsI)
VLVPLLLGLGVEELSAAPPLVPAIKYLIRRLKLSEAQELAQWALSCEVSTEILARCEALTRQAAPSLFENRLETR